MITPKEFEKINQRSIIPEIITFIVIIFVTIFVVFYFPYSKAMNSLVYVLVGGMVTTTFWYLRTRRMYDLTLRTSQEMVKNNQLLIKERQTAETILKHSIDGVLLVDNNKRIVGFSPSLERISGFSESEMIGKIFDQALIFGNKPGAPNIGDLLLSPKNRTENASYISNTLKQKDGTFVDLEINYKAFRDKTTDKIFGLAFIKDVTYEREIKQRDNKFITLASHQIFTPLSMIRGFLSLILEQRIGKLNQKQKLYAEKAYESAKRLVSLIGSFLSISSIENEKSENKIKEFDLVKTIKGIVQEFENAGQSKKNNISITSPARVFINSDQEKVEHIFYNCLDNAIKYGDDGQIKIVFDDQKNQTIIKIIDKGIGIPQNEIERIGDKFYRAANAINKDPKGTGLGVFMTNFLAEKISSKLILESTEGQGTTAIITLAKKIK